MSVETETPRTTTAGAVDTAEPASAAVLDELLAFLLGTAAVFVGLAGLLIGVAGPAEAWETSLWVIAVLVGLPGGVALARAQRTRGAITPLGVALSSIALAAGFALRWQGSGSTTYNLLLGLGGIAAAALPFAVAGSALRAAPGWRAVPWVAAAVIAAPFIPRSATGHQAVRDTLVIAVLAFLVLRLLPEPRLPRATKLALDAVVVLGLVLLVVHLPDLRLWGPTLTYHQDFYLGPVNDVAHGRVVLADVWSQYGVGMVAGLRAAFAVVPLGFGGMTLLVALTTALQYVVFYATLRAATGRLVLTGAATFTAILGQAFNLPGSYLEFPSTGPLRFGPAYLLVGLAVLGATRPRWANAGRWVQLLVVALAAIWSFETFVYTFGTFVAITLVERLASDGPRLRPLARDVGQALAAAVAALLTFTVVIAIIAGSADWGPYIDYVRAYQTGTGALPVVFHSAGPLMGAVTILSAAGLAWIALERRVRLATAERVALAGFTGFAISSFTYYLGRSAPTNLAPLLPPVIGYLTVWTSVFLGRRGAPASERVLPRTPAAAAAAVLITAATAMVVSAWPSVQVKWTSTALAQTMPSFADGVKPGANLSLRAALQSLWHNPVMDDRAPVAERLIAAHWQPGAPVLTLMPSDLTTETLMRADRRNLLPISHPAEDNLVDPSADRARAAVAKLPPGTLMLLDEEEHPELGDEFDRLERATLRAVRQRFTLRTIDHAETIRVVRLLPR